MTALCRRTWIAAAFLAVASCLPSDDRPPPGTVLVRVEASSATTAGFATDDGWTVTIESFLTAMGNTSLDDPEDSGMGPDAEGPCNAYSDPRYDRLFEATLLTSPAKVGLSYGLGTCSVRYRVRNPSEDSILEPGVTSDELAFMRLEATDAYETDARVAVWVRGHAARGDVTKRFEWVFRRGTRISTCPDASGERTVNVTKIAAGDAHTFDVVLAAEELFRVRAEDGAPLGFDLYAVADADGDGQITLAELATVPAPPGSAGTGGTDGAGGMAATAADLLYDELLPRVSRFAGGGACETEMR